MDVATGVPGAFARQSSAMDSGRTRRLPHTGRASAREVLDREMTLGALAQGPVPWAVGSQSFLWAPWPCSRDSAPPDAQQARRADT